MSLLACYSLDLFCTVIYNESRNKGLNLPVCYFCCTQLKLQELQLNYTDANLKKNTDLLMLSAESVPVSRKKQRNFKFYAWTTFYTSQVGNNQAV